MMVVSLNNQYDVTLLDDGTMDTVVEISHKRWDEPKEYRYSTECASAYRDNDGVLDMQSFIDDIVIPDAELEE